MCYCERIDGERKSAVFTQLKTCLPSDGRRTDIPKLFVLNNEQPQPLRGLLILRPTLRKRSAKQTSAGTLWNKDLIKAHSSHGNEGESGPEITLYITIHNRILAIAWTDGLTQINKSKSEMNARAG